ncbi:MAG: hypothetical protein Q9174_000425 [Haloplaca sp. 1 TL-2023]
MAGRAIDNGRISAIKDVSDSEGDSSITSVYSRRVPEVHDNGPKHDSEDSAMSHDRSTTLDVDTNMLSFGALAKAQEDMSRVSNPRGTYTPEFGDLGNAEAQERKLGKRDRREHTRSSKHAPAEMSSKKAVSRKREVVPTNKIDVRDPRFEPTSGPLDEQRAKQNYDFLDAYRDSEIADLKAGIKQTKDAAAKEKMKRAVLSMESRKQTQRKKDQEQEVLKAHRAKERDLVKQGKKPFYLKKGEQKKLALVQRFEGMKGKQVEKVIERRRKKRVQRERKSMPDSRRAPDV